MQKNKKRAYPAFIREDEGMQLVYVPDFAIFTEGHDLVDAIEMARDAIGMTGKAYEEDGKELPEPSDYEEAITRAELIKSDFDYTKGYLTLVDVSCLPEPVKADQETGTVMIGEFFSFLKTVSSGR